MRRNADDRLRALERRLENGDETDVLAYLAELERSGTLKDLQNRSSDLRPGLQKKILEIMKERATRTGSRDDAEAYLKALRYFAPGSDGDLMNAIAIALMDREVDPFAVWLFLRSGQDAWDEFVGPLLDPIEVHCEQLQRTLSAPGRARVRRTLQQRRQAAAEGAAAAFDFGDEGQFAEWSGWQYSNGSDIWYRTVFLQPLDDDGDPLDGDSVARTLNVEFEPGTATVVETTLD